MHDLDSIASQFLIPGDFRSAAPYGSGHINDTYAVVFCQAGTEVRYIFQRINHNPFFPALRSGPPAVSGAFRKKQIPWRQPKPCEPGMALVNQNH